MDHQVVNILVRDAGFGEGLAAGNAEGTEGGFFFSHPRDSGVQGQRFEACSTGFPLSRE